MSALLVVTFLATVAVALVLVHRDGMAMGQERERVATERRLRSLARLQDREHGRDR